MYVTDKRYLIHELWGGFIKHEGRRGERAQDNTKISKQRFFGFRCAINLFLPVCVLFVIRSFGVSCEIVIEGSGFLVHVLFLRYFGLILINFHDSSKNTYSVICLLVTHDWRLFLTAPVWVCSCQIGSLFASFAKSFGPQM